MSRKDFQLIAETIRFLPFTPENKRNIAENFAQSLHSTNARFDSDRFIAACTIPTAGETQRAGRID